MKTKLSLYVSSLVFLLLLACSPEANSLDKGKAEEHVEVSQSFHSGSYTMIGEEGKVGFIYGDDVEFKANQEQKYMWHLWGESAELNEGLFKVIATHTETGEQVPVVQKRKLSGPNNGADAHLPTMMSLPGDGIWKLDAYVGEELFGTVVVKVKEA